MIDEGKLNLARERGAQADLLLRNDLLQEAFKTMEADYIKAWAATEPSQAEARENFWRALQILADVRRHLIMVSNGGKLAQQELAELATRFQPKAS
jgi:hypothetical protein